MTKIFYDSEQRLHSLWCILYTFLSPKIYLNTNKGYFWRKEKWNVSNIWKGQALDLHTWWRLSVYQKTNKQLTCTGFQRWRANSTPPGWSWQGYEPLRIQKMEWGCLTVGLLSTGSLVGYLEVLPQKQISKLRHQMVYSETFLDYKLGL